MDLIAANRLTALLDHQGEYHNDTIELLQELDRTVQTNPDFALKIDIITDIYSMVSFQQWSSSRLMFNASSFDLSYKAWRQCFRRLKMWDRIRYVSYDCPTDTGSWDFAYRCSSSALRLLRTSTVVSSECSISIRNKRYSQIALPRLFGETP
jgi:hypothetical protein